MLINSSFKDFGSAGTPNPQSIMAPLIRSAVELWEDMEMEGGDMDFGSFYIAMRAVEIWAEAKEEAEIWDVADDVIDQDEMQMVEIWADAEEVAEAEDVDATTEQEGSDLRGVRKEKSWEEAEEQRGLGDVTVYTSMKEKISVWIPSKGVEIRFEEKAGSLISAMGVKMSAISIFHFRNFIATAYDGKVAQGRSIADFSSSKWRDKEVDVDEIWLSNLLVRIENLNGSSDEGFTVRRIAVDSHSKGNDKDDVYLHLLVSSTDCSMEIPLWCNGSVRLNRIENHENRNKEVKFSGGGGVGAEREFSVSNWWWWCNGFEEAAEVDNLLENLVRNGGAVTGSGGEVRKFPVSGWWWWCNGFENVAGEDDVCGIQNSNFELFSLYWVVLSLLSECLYCANGLLGVAVGCLTVGF